MKSWKWKIISALYFTRCIYIYIYIYIFSINITFGAFRICKLMSVCAVYLQIMQNKNNTNYILNMIVRCLTPVTHVKFSSNQGGGISIQLCCDSYIHFINSALSPIKITISYYKEYEYIMSLNSFIFIIETITVHIFYYSRLLANIVLSHDES